MGYVAQAIDKNSGIFKTCTHADKELAYKTAKYYRSVGYRAKVFAEDEYEKALEDNITMRNQEIRNQEGVRKYDL